MRRDTTQGSDHARSLGMQSLFFEIESNDDEKCVATQLPEETVRAVKMASGDLLASRRPEEIVSLLITAVRVQSASRQSSLVERHSSGAVPR